MRGNQKYNDTYKDKNRSFGVKKVKKIKLTNDYMEFKKIVVSKKVIQKLAVDLSRFIQ